MPAPVSVSPQAPVQLATRGYAICTSPRSGSTFLCRLLESTGVLGRPMEFFNTKDGRKIDPDYPEDPHGQVHQVLTAGATPNGVYGLKLFPHQHDLVAKEVRWTQALPNLRFVHLERRDLLGQAISTLRADQTQQFHSTSPEQAHPSYSAEALSHYIDVVLVERTRWAIFFARNGIDPVHLVYEDLLRDAQSAIDKVAALVGIEGKATVNPDLVDLKIQRDAVSDDWRRRFIAETKGGAA